MNLRQLIEDKFSSGNNIEVERITITRAEYEAAISEPVPQFRLSVKMVQALRDETNEPMMECKRALYACNGNHEKAVEWLHTNHFSGHRTHCKFNKSLL